MSGPGSRIVHLWRFRLEREPGEEAALTALLASDERERAAAFHFARDRRRFAVARGTVRRLLGARLGLRPEAVRFVYGPQGKPALAGGELQFNLSHSGEWALLAIGEAPAIGVDLEQVRPLRDLLGLAQRFFAPGEVARLLALPGAEQLAAFYQCWTRKEAFIKALGAGLAYPLDGFEVSFGPGVPARLISVAGDPDAPDRWALHRVPAPNGYEAAVALPPGWEPELEDGGPFSL